MSSRAHWLPRLCVVNDILIESVLQLLVFFLSEHCAGARATGAGRGRSARGGGRGSSIGSRRRSRRSRCVGGSRRRPSFFAVQRQQFFGLVTLFKRAVSARRRDARYGGGVYACLRRGRPRQTSVYGAPRLQNLPCETRFTTARGAPHESAALENFRDSAVSSKVSTSRVTEFVEPRANGRPRLTSPRPTGGPAFLRPIDRIRGPTGVAEQTRF